MRHKPTDTELLHVAFDEWKRENGMGPMIGLGDIDNKILGDVLRRAQAMKLRAQEQKTA
ncbi:MAG TPA: hypothetical protein VHX63_18090 [Acidobacteriaceae bacterium]|jgi:hypothetical protein|nr:hypothetical protein [Acidobacteriaceae bacterium]